MSLLITGGTGYIGSHIAIEASVHGYDDIVIIDNLSNSKRDVISAIKKISPCNITFYELDLIVKDKLHKVFQTHNIKSVLHLAGLKSVSASIQDPITYYENNISGTINLINVMREYSVYKIIFSSSATVYGNPIKLPIKESESLKPVNPYGKTKEIIEILLNDLTFSSKHDSTPFKSAILRYFNPIGAHPSGLIGESPNDTPNNLMPYLLSTANRKFKELSVYGNHYNTKDGTGVRDYIHVVDLAKAHIQAIKLLDEKLDSSSNISFPYIANIGTGQGYSVLEIIKTFEQVNKCKIPYSIVKRRSGDIATSYADPTYAQRTLKWKAQLSLKDMCKDAWNWAKQY